MARIAMIALMLLAAAPALAQENDTSAPAPAAPADSNGPGDDTVAAPERTETPPATPPPARAGGADLRESVCMMIESAARAQNLPLEFFARVIWQESRFQPNIVGPRTRSGERAPERVIKPGCSELMALLHRAPNPFVQNLEERVNLVAVAPWGVQLAAGFSREHALSNYATLAKRYGEILTGRDPSLLSSIF